MNETVRAAIAREIALLEKVIPTPVEPFGYGVDSAGVLDIDDTCSLIDQYSVQSISEGLARRFQTPRGSLRDDLE